MEKGKATLINSNGVKPISLSLVISFNASLSIWRMKNRSLLRFWSTRSSSDGNGFKVVLFVGCHDFSWVEKHQNPNSTMPVHPAAHFSYPAAPTGVQLYKALESQTVAPFWPPNTKWRMLQVGRATKLACIEQNNTTYTDIRYMRQIWNVELCKFEPLHTYFILQNSSNSTKSIHANLNSQPNH